MRYTMHFVVDYKTVMNEFLSKITGLIHVGAHSGQERDLYTNLNVIWIEANPEIVDDLKKNISNYRNQRAFCALVTDETGKIETFHISNCGGTPSSLYEFGRHKELWPDIKHIKHIKLETITLQDLIEKHGINIKEFQALVIDVQGAELLVLKGAIPLFPYLRFVQLEVADGESYLGGCQLKDIESFMMDHSFGEIHRNLHNAQSNGLHYYDILYENNANN